MGFCICRPGVVVVASALLLAVASDVCAQFPPELRGRVSDVTSGAPIAGVEIFARGLAEHVVSSADGSFLVRGLAPGASTIRARRLGYASDSVVVDLANGQVTVTSIALRPVPQELSRIATSAVREGSISPNATSVGRDAILASGAASAAEVLEREPGLVVTRQGGPDAPATVSIRGSESNQVLVLVDGVPVNDALTGVADLSSISTNSIERIVILRGAQTARYGPQALGGVVLVETRRASEAAEEITNALGSWGDQRTSASVSDAISDGASRIAARVDAEQRRVGGQFAYAVPVTRGGGIGTRDNDDSRQRDVDAQLSFARENVDVSLGGDWLDVDRGMPGSIVQPSLTGRQTQDRGGVSASARLTPGAWRIEADWQTQRQTARYVDPSPPFGGAFDTQVRATTTLGTLSFERTLSEWSLSGGVEHRHIGASGTALQQGVDPSQSLTSAWTDETWTHATLDSTQLELSAAARVDDHSLLPSAVFSPRVQATLSRGSVSAFASWGRAFAPPSLADLFFQEGVQTQSNPSLAPERVKNEVTTGVRLARRAFGPLSASGDVTAFRADVDGMILWFPDFRFVWRPDNFNVRRRGVESQIATGLWGDALQLRANATYAQVDYVGPVLNGQVIYRPEWSGGATLSAALPALFVADASWRETGSRTTNVGSTLNTIPSFGTLDVAVHRQFMAPRLTIDARAGVENVLDTHAVMLPDYPFPGRGWTVSLRLASRDK